MDGLDALGRLVGELQRLQDAAKRAEHERAFWEDRYRVQHGTVHRLEARLQAAEHALREADGFLSDPDGKPVDSINFARAIILAALAAAERGEDD
jgi:predicted nuclease with TOPRIM domain